LTEWVMAAAAKQKALWDGENIRLDVAVNISARDINERDTPDRLEQQCRDAGISPTSIILELTETGATHDTEAVQTMDVLTRLRLKGFRLAIDDFGTGYASLAQLHRMPFSEVKVDRSFVMQMTKNKSCRDIVENTIGLARKLGLKSVAEDVEEAAALSSLAAMGCDMAQGYYISRPVAGDRIPELASRHYNIEAVI
jgi:EAL domain-containing protein (putative c-di-GMP-specific phosphodiesterase class I)